MVLFQALLLGYVCRVTHTIEGLIHVTEMDMIIISLMNSIIYW